MAMKGNCGMTEVPLECMKEYLKGLRGKLERCVNLHRFLKQFCKAELGALRHKVGRNRAWLQKAYRLLTADLKPQ